MILEVSTLQECIYTLIMGTAEGFLQLLCLARLADKKLRIPHVLLFISLYHCLLISWTSLLPSSMGMVSAFLLLFGFGVWAFRVSWSESLIMAVLILETLMLCYGATNSLTGILSPVLFRYAVLRPVLGLFMMILGSALAMVLAFMIFRALWKHFTIKNAMHTQYIFMILTPLVMILLISEYILHTIYGNVVTINDNGVMLGANHLHIFLLQCLCITSLFCIIHSSRKLSAALELQTRLRLIQQQTALQEQYVEEARQRYEQTRAFRHDIKNHLAVIKGMIEKNGFTRAEEYLNEMERATASLSFPFYTNNPVLDILLESKLGPAMSDGVSVGCTLQVPHPCHISDMDLCIVLSNALDNAIRACKNAADCSMKYIQISSQLQGSFFMLEVKNGYDPAGETKGGTGLGLLNIQTIAQKYNGSSQTSYHKNSFVLNVLFNLSQQTEDTLQQKN